MKITEVAQIAPSKNPHNVDVRKVFESPDTSAVVITLKPGESLRKHVTPVDVFFYTLEGTGVVEIGDERQSVAKDSVVESPAMIPHTWRNESDAVTLGDLKIENREDHVAIYGRLAVTRDRAGLAAAKELKELVDRIVKELETGDDLPIRVASAEQPDKVKNPFGQA